MKTITQSDLRFAWVAIPIVMGLSFTPAMAQSGDNNEQGCPAGYWRMASLCFNSTTGDITMREAIP